MRVGIGRHSKYLEHLNGPGHPERPERLAAVDEALQSLQGDIETVDLPTRPATRRELELAHEPAYLNRLESTRNREITVFDADTLATDVSYDVALLAAGGAIEAVSAALSGDPSRSFVFSRPPGHHAEADRAMGFCLLNNAAIAAAYAIAERGLPRVAVVDWDVHHGNGTAHSFANRRDVLYVSLHEYPHYPGTGTASDVGTGEGSGFTVNIPLPSGCSDSDYLYAMHTVVVPILRDYSPELIIVSAGFDGHRNDPLSGMRLSEYGYSAITELLVGVADDCSAGRVVHLLEGGYDLAGIAEGVRAVLRALGRDTKEVGEPSTTDSATARAAVDSTRRVLAGHWEVLNRE